MGEPQRLQTIGSTSYTLAIRRARYCARLSRSFELPPGSRMEASALKPECQESMWRTHDPESRVVFLVVLASFLFETAHSMNYDLKDRRIR